MKSVQWKLYIIFFILLLCAGITSAVDNSTSVGVGVQYPPHNVRIVLLDYFGAPLPNVTVSAIPLQTTMGEWEWVTNLFGINITTVDVQNATLTGTTGLDGSISFLMFETIKYNVTCSGGDTAVNYETALYPHETEIFLYVPTTNAPNTTLMTDNVTWALTITSAGGTSTLACTYTDTSGATTALTFDVIDQNGTVVHTENAGAPNSFSSSHDVTETQCTSYTWGFNATRGGEVHSAAKAVTFPCTVTTNVPPDYMQWVATGFLLVIGALFSKGSVRFGAIVLPLFAFWFTYIGWLSVGAGGATILASLLIFGVLSYIRKAETRIGT
jgi:hypothetical protein